MNYPNKWEPIGHYLHANREAQGRRTFQNAYKLERAIWRYIADNNGLVPNILGDTNLAGNTMYDYLPGNQPLLNPYTRQRTEPTEGSALYKGSVGYLSILDNQGYLIGFVISAMGEEPNRDLEIIGYSSPPDGGGG